MGYASRYTGEIRIDPPLSWWSIRDSEYVPGRNGRTASCVRFNIVETTEDTDDGVLLKRSAIGIMVCPEEHSHYEVERCVNEIVTGYEANFSGFLEGIGEDGERWRIAVVDRGDLDGVHVERFEPVITWPIEAQGGAS